MKFWWEKQLDYLNLQADVPALYQGVFFIVMHVFAMNLIFTHVLFVLKKHNQNTQQLETKNT